MQRSWSLWDECTSTCCPWQFITPLLKLSWLAAVTPTDIIKRHKKTPERLLWLSLHMIISSSKFWLHKQKSLYLTLPSFMYKTPTYCSHEVNVVLRSCEKECLWHKVWEREKKRDRGEFPPISNQMDLLSIVLRALVNNPRCQWHILWCLLPAPPSVAFCYFLL